MAARRAWEQAFLPPLLTLDYRLFALPKPGCGARVGAVWRCGGEGLLFGGLEWKKMDKSGVD
jgi:hypothetical protein